VASSERRKASYRKYQNSPKGRARAARAKEKRQAQRAEQQAEQEAVLAKIAKEEELNRQEKEAATIRASLPSLAPPKAERNPRVGEAQALQSILARPHDPLGTEQAREMIRLREVDLGVKWPPRRPRKRSMYWWQDEF
jgi:hypothetical protein